MRLSAKPAMNQLREDYLAKAKAAETNAAAAEDPATKENWQKLAETFRQLAARLK
jgi:hypothetical protein